MGVGRFWARCRRKRSNVLKMSRNYKLATKTSKKHFIIFHQYIDSIHLNTSQCMIPLSYQTSPTPRPQRHGPFPPGSAGSEPLGASATWTSPATAGGRGPSSITQQDGEVTQQNSDPKWWGVDKIGMTKRKCYTQWSSSYLSSQALPIC